MFFVNTRRGGGTVKQIHPQGKGSVFRSMLISYLIIFLIPVCLFLLGSRFYLSALNEQISSANQAALSTLARSVDTQIDILFSTSSRLLVDTRTLRLTRQETVAAKRDYEDLSELRSQIVDDVLHSDYISDICLYFPKSDLWLCKDGILRGMDGFQYYLSKNLPIGADEWEAGLHFNGRKSERLVNANGQQLLLVHKYANTRAEDALPSVLAVIRVNTEALRSLLAAFNDSGTAVFRILAPDGTAIQTDDASLNAATIVDSSAAQLRYVLYPMAKIARFAALIRLIVVIFVFGVLLSGALILLFSKRHSSPIQRLTGSLLSQMQMETPPAQDEYKLLEQEISFLLRKIHRSEGIAVEYESMKNDRILQGLMQGAVGAIENAAEILGRGSERFVVALHSAGRADLSDTGPEEGEGSLDVIDLIVKTVAKYESGADEKRFVFTMDGMIVCLIVLGGMPDPDALDRIEASARGSAEYLLNRFKVSSSIAVSPVVNGVESLQEAFVRARELLDYQLLTGSGDISVVRVDQAREAETPLARPSLGPMYSNMQLFVEQVQSHSYALARQTFLRTLAERIPSSSPGDPRPVRMHLFAMADLLAMTIKDLDEEVASHIRREALLEDLYSCESVSSLHACAEEVFSELEKHSAQSRHGVERGQRILSFLGEHYQEPEINVNTLSQQFDLSPSYVSMLIKKQTGLSAVDYIHSLRIGQAKRLLREQPDMLIKDVSREVGYGTSLNLIRAFKRYEGMTPTQFRESM